MCNYCATREARKYPNYVEVFIAGKSASLDAGCSYGKSGGEGGIRTPGTGFSQYNGLANRRIQPLCHLSAEWFQQLTTKLK